LGFGELNRLEVRECVARDFGAYLVLDDDVGLEALTVLGDEVGSEGGRECGVKCGERLGLEEDSNPFADGAGRRAGQQEGIGFVGGLADHCVGEVLVGELVEECQVSGNRIAIGREVAVAEGVVEGL
jgi:hypothetical protein